jgi:hypothetical protein
LFGAPTSSTSRSKARAAPKSSQVALSAGRSRALSTLQAAAVL